MGNEGKSNESYRILWLSNSMADDTNGVHCPMCESGGAPAGGVASCLCTVGADALHDYCLAMSLMLIFHLASGRADCAR